MATKKPTAEDKARAQAEKQQAGTVRIKARTIPYKKVSGRPGQLKRRDNLIAFDEENLARFKRNPTEFVVAVRRNLEYLDARITELER